MIKKSNCHLYFLLTIKNKLLHLIYLSATKTPLDKEEKKPMKICEYGHRFYKSSDCPICPVCEKNKKTTATFLSELGAPARRALENNKITTLEQLATFTEKEILQFHGLGKSSIPKLQKMMEAEKLSFKK